MAPPASAAAGLIPPVPAGAPSGAPAAPVPPAVPTAWPGVAEDAPPRLPPPVVESRPAGLPLSIARLALPASVSPVSRRLGSGLAPVFWAERDSVAAKP